MSDCSVPDGLYTKVVNVQGQWYREVYIGSPYLWRFITMIEIDPEQAAREREV
jgi:hypothetical protein